MATNKGTKCLSIDLGLLWVETGEQIFFTLLLSIPRVVVIPMLGWVWLFLNKIFKYRLKVALWGDRGEL